MSNLQNIIDDLAQIKELNLHLGNNTELVKEQLNTTFNLCNGLIITELKDPNKTTHDMLVMLGLHIAQDVINRIISSIGLYSTGAIDKKTDMYTEMVKSVQTAIHIACDELSKTLKNILTCSEEDAKVLIDELQQNRN